MSEKVKGKREGGAKFSLFDQNFVPRKIVRIRALSYILPRARILSLPTIFRFQAFGNEYWFFLRRPAKEDTRRQISDAAGLRAAQLNEVLLRHFR